MGGFIPIDSFIDHSEFQLLPRFPFNMIPEKRNIKIKKLISALDIVKVAIVLSHKIVGLSFGYGVQMFFAELRHFLGCQFEFEIPGNRVN